MTSRNLEERFLLKELDEFSAEEKSYVAAIISLIKKHDRFDLLKEIIENKICRCDEALELLSTVEGKAR